MTQENEQARSKIIPEGYDLGGLAGMTDEDISKSFSPPIVTLFIHPEAPDIDDAFSILEQANIRFNLERTNREGIVFATFGNIYAGDGYRTDVHHLLHKPDLPHTIARKNNYALVRYPVGMQSP